MVWINRCIQYETKDDDIYILVNRDRQWARKGHTDIYVHCTQCVYTPNNIWRKIKTHLFRNWPHPQTLYRFNWFFHTSCLLLALSLSFWLPSKQLSKNDLHIPRIFTLHIAMEKTETETVLRQKRSEHGQNRWNERKRSKAV